jgi:hypothetical protein
MNSSKTQLIQQITQAFASMQREDGITLHQAIAMDDRLSGKEVALARKKDTDKNWQEIDLKQLGNFNSALAFMDKKGFKYYLPCFMLASLLEYIEFDTPLFYLTHLKGLSQRRSTANKFVKLYDFNKKQIVAITLFLQYVYEFEYLFQNPVFAEQIKQWEKLSEKV